MTYNTILIDHVDHVGVITLNRPEQLNTFTGIEPCPYRAG